MVKGVHENILNADIVGLSDQNRKGDREHVLLHALDQPLFAVLHETDKLSDVLRTAAGDLGDLFVIPSLIVQVFEFARKFHRGPPTAG